MVRECKFGRRCNRPDCYFFHAHGREIDDLAAAAAAATNPMAYSAAAAAAAHTTADMEHEMRSMLKAERDQERRDEWYPDARDCDCCKGFKYGCSDATCRQLGVCGCQYKG